MSRKQCDNCVKTFRSDSGLAWHTSHIHEQDTESDMPCESDSPGNQWTNVQDILTRLGSLEEMASIIGARQDDDAATIELTMVSWRQHITDFADRLTRLEERVESMIQTLGSLEQLRRQMDEEKGFAESLSGDVVAMKDVLTALCVVLWNLDLDHKANRSFRDIPTRPSKAILAQAKDVVRDQSQTEVPAWISNLVTQVMHSR